MVCDRLEACTSPAIMRLVYGGTARCKERQALQIELDGLAKGYRATEAEAKACKDAMTAASCADVFAGIPPEPCRIPGELADGAPCTGDGQCASLACYVADDAICGTCGRRVPEGADCSAAKCELGLDCSRAKKCVKLGAEGAPCGGPSDPECEILLHCGEGKCVRGLPKGERCQLHDGAVPCDSFKGLVCVPTTGDDGTCEDYTIVGVGEACRVVSIDPPRFAFCENSDCVRDKCVPRIPDGEICVPTDLGGIACQQPAHCREGKCVLRDPSKCQ